MKVRTLLTSLLVVAVVGACSGGKDDAASPVVTPGDGPSGGTIVTVGAVQLSLPAQMEPLEGDDGGSGITKGRYRSTVQDDHGRAAAVVVPVADQAQRAAKAEGEALVGYQKDVAKGTDLRSGPIDWPGFESAYGIEYDAAGAQAGDPLHNLVVVASTKEGGLVNVSVAAPPTLFDSLQLKAAVASLQPARVRS